MKPKIAISMGDPAGIGPELIIKLFKRNDIGADLIVVGDIDILEAANEVLGSKVTLRSIGSAAEADFGDESAINVLNKGLLTKDKFAIGRATADCGKGSVEYLLETARLARDGFVDAIVSAPLNKEAMKLGGTDFQGQTELLADFFGVSDYAMILCFGPIKLFYQTNHVSLKEAIDGVLQEKVLNKIRFIDKVLHEMREQNDSIAVLALNPHAGENGKMGQEEIEQIIPAIETAKAEGINVIGPLPADTAFIKAKDGVYGAVLAMYHDQGNIAAKLLDFGAGVTYIAGLPIIRTSVAHGTAYDIAGTGIADESTLAEAVKMAEKLIGERTV